MLIGNFHSERILIDELGPGVVSQNAETAREAPLQAQLQGMINGVAVLKEPSHRTVLGSKQAPRIRVCQSRLARNVARRVDLAWPVQMCSFGAHVRCAQK